MKEYKLITYRTPAGKLPLWEWLEDFTDQTISRRLTERIDRLRLGLYGDYKSVGGGVYELRFHFGAGYRIYFAQEKDEIILLLCGGDKKTQAKDIKKAKEYLMEFKEQQDG